MDFTKMMDLGKGSLWEKLRNMGPKHWAVLLLLGLLLAVASLPVSREEKTPEQETGTAAQETTGENSQLEEKLAGLLSESEGVGKVRVILMTDEEKDAGGFYSAGTTRVTGVLIAAQGADNPVVVRSIQEGICALFHIEPHKIKIMKLGA